MSLNLNCKMICAAQASYAIETNTNGEPLMAVPIGVTNPLYSQQYNALNVVGFPYIVSKSTNAALVCATETEIIIAFRGTLSSKSISTIEDIFEDLLTFPKTNSYLPGKTHSGFLDAVVDLVDGVQMAVTMLKNKHGVLPVYITGHSKGGGMAPIAAMYLKAAYGLEITNVVTIAGPNCGNSDFAGAYNQAYPNTLAFQNYLDIIPLLPPTASMIGAMEVLPLFDTVKILLLGALLWDYTAVGQINYIDGNGEIAPPPSDSERIDAIDAAWSLPNHPVLEAHHASCGFRYMENVCNGQGVCLFQPINPSN